LDGVGFPLVFAPESIGFVPGASVNDSSLALAMAMEDRAPFGDWWRSLWRSFFSRFGCYPTPFDCGFVVEHIVILESGVHVYEGLAGGIAKRVVGCWGQLKEVCVIPVDRGFRRDNPDSTVAQSCFDPIRGPHSIPLEVDIVV
jgi:hypothetical protein